MNENELMQKLAISKAIMDKSDNIKKGELPPTSLQEFHSPTAKYNIPSDILREESQEPFLSSIPNTKSVGVPTIDAIKNSRLPDEIKKLMIEHPIVQPQMQQTSTLSNELVEKASKLMGINKKSTPTQKQNISESSDLKKILKEVVQEVLKENGLISESSEKSNENFTFRVGKHIFEGKVTKIKKVP